MDSLLLLILAVLFGPSLVLWVVAMCIYTIKGGRS